MDTADDLMTGASFARAEGSYKISGGPINPVQVQGSLGRVARAETGSLRSLLASVLVARKQNSCSRT